MHGFGSFVPSPSRFQMIPTWHSVLRRDKSFLPRISSVLSQRGACVPHRTACPASVAPLVTLQPIKRQVLDVKLGLTCYYYSYHEQYSSLLVVVSWISFRIGLAFGWSMSCKAGIGSKISVHALVFFVYTWRRKQRHCPEYVVDAMLRLL